MKKTGINTYILSKEDIDEFKKGKFITIEWVTLSLKNGNIKIKAEKNPFIFDRKMFIDLDSNITDEHYFIDNEFVGIILTQKGNKNRNGNDK